MPNPDTIIFLHIPKTAGSTLNAILQKQYKRQQIYYLGANTQESIRSYLDLADEEKKSIRLVTGHTAYGFHEYIPGSSTYFTFFRDPVERVVSFYHFVKNNEQHYLNKAAVNEFDGIKPFITSGITTMMDNGQTRLISGAWLDPGFGEINEQILAQAKTNLSKKFSVVGLTEQFDATLILFKEIFNWQDIKYMRKNVTKVAPVERILTAEEKEAVVSLNQYDIALYDYAQTLFEQQIAAIGPDFSRQLANFQRQNQLYQSIGEPIRKTIRWARQHSIRTAIRRRFT